MWSVKEGRELVRVKNRGKETGRVACDRSKEVVGRRESEEQGF